ncbi:hypothetical protein RJ639_002933 [Escallonia herrerae]|uniref:Serine protease n=1 Tax=Escallonia herrerae TaxID=1293975 RepID=A0AA89AWR9_9ASTE|nr:hypothetical protein RJ639_002933 [Escallonia herrerae]
MLGRNVWLRREYLYRKSLEGKERLLCGKKRKITETLEEGKPKLTELRNKGAALRQEIDLEDENTATYEKAATGIVVRGNRIMCCSKIFDLPKSFYIRLGLERRLEVLRSDPYLEITHFEISINPNAGEPKRRTGEIILQDHILDLAALECRPLFPLLPEAKLATVDYIEIGQSLYCLSNQGGIPNYFSKGRVVNPGCRTLSDLKSDRCVMYHDIRIGDGCSGAALFTADLEVVAMCLSPHSDSLVCNMGLKVSELERFLKRVEELESQWMQQK